MPADADRRSMELKRRDLEGALERLTARAQAIADGGRDPGVEASGARRPS